MPIYNFSAGPSMLPEAVLCEIESAFKTSRHGITECEISHRSAAFLEIVEQTEAKLRRLLQIPEHYQVLFLQGGARHQFSMIPMNFLGTSEKAGYVLSGFWSKMAFEDATHFCQPSLVANTETKQYQVYPAPDTWKIDTELAYVHCTPNETVNGVQMHQEPSIPKEVPLVADMSSELLSKPIPVNQYSLIYASTQKNLGIAGLTVVILDEKKLKAPITNTPLLYRYSAHIAKRSLLNTPPTFTWFVVNLMLQWLIDLGGLSVIQKKNAENAKMLYDFIDNSSFYYNPIEKLHRSQMNVVFYLDDDSLEAKFFKAAEARGLYGLSGHRLVGGCRASLYNAMPKRGVEQLIAFMKDFAAGRRS